MGLVDAGESGRINIELRRESFVIHVDDGDEREHPEYLLSDLPDLIAALQMVNRRKEADRR